MDREGPGILGGREPGGQGADGLAARMGHVDLGEEDEDELDDDESQEMDADTDDPLLDETYNLQHDFDDRFYTQAPPASYATQVPHAEALHTPCFRCLRRARTQGANTGPPRNSNSL